MIEKALQFAVKAHEGQVRKYTGEPYVLHPIMVMKYVKVIGCGEPVQVAALLHDVVEDTPVTLAEIEKEFGYVVAELVAFCTEVSSPAYGNRAQRKKLDADHYASGPAAAQTIKVADLIDNGVSIKEHDPSFWRIFKREKEYLLSVLTKADKRLVNIAYWMMDT